MSELGTVKWFNTDKGFGFIIPDNGDGDVFFHVTTLTKCNIAELREGDRVGYDLRINATTKKAAAVNIKLMNGGAAST